MGSKAAKPLVIGVDMGGTKILASVIEGEKNILGTAKKRTRAERGAEYAIEQIVEAVKESLKEAKAKPEDVGAMCIGAPGPLDPVKGIVISAPNLKWKDVKLKAILEKALGITTLLENDVNIGTYGEFKLGAGKGTGDLVGIFVGTGIGGGLVIDGKLHRGFNHTAGEIGHLVVRMGGPRCGCGNQGCLEAIAGRAAMTTEMSHRMERMDGKLLLELSKGDIAGMRSSVLAKAYKQGDPVVTSVLNEGIEALGAAVGSIVNLLSPEVVVIGGGIAEALGKPFVTQVAKSAKLNAFPQSIKNVKIVPAALGDLAGVLGAGLLARESLKS